MPFSVCGSDHFPPVTNSVTDQNLLVLHLQDQINRISRHVVHCALQKDSGKNGHWVAPDYNFVFRHGPYRMVISSEIF